MKTWANVGSFFSILLLISVAVAGGDPKSEIGREVAIRITWRTATNSRSRYETY